MSLVVIDRTPLLMNIRRSTKLEKKDSIQNKTIESEVTKTEADNEQDEMDIMSQYLMQPAAEPVEGNINT